MKLAAYLFIALEIYFDIVNRLGVAHKCDEQTDGQTLSSKIPSCTALRGQKLRLT